MLTRKLTPWRFCSTSNSPDLTTYSSDADAPRSPSLMRISPACTGRSYMADTTWRCTAGSRSLNSNRLASRCCVSTRGVAGRRGVHRTHRDVRPVCFGALGGTGRQLKRLVRLACLCHTGRAARHNSRGAVPAQVFIRRQVVTHVAPGETGFAHDKAFAAPWTCARDDVVVCMPGCWHVRAVGETLDSDQRCACRPFRGVEAALKYCGLMVYCRGVAGAHVKRANRYCANPQP